MILRSALVGAMACAIGFPSLAQQRQKLGFPLEAYVEKNRASSGDVHVFIHGEQQALAAAVRAHGGTVKMARTGLVSARVPVARVHELAEEPAVKRFEFSLDRGYVLNDSMRVKNRIDLIQSGQAPLPEAYNGEGTIIGIIDSGLDHRHGDFKDASGRTRILKYWDQTLAFNAQTTPQPYGYGQVWDSTAINAGLMTSIDQQGYTGHGTTVTGTAAGNGLANGLNKGAAPRADIIVVSTQFSGDFRGHVADGVKYIFEQAELLGRPAVVNASLGSYLGSHDGKDAAALFIDDLLMEAPGRVMVCAAGNSNSYPAYHIRTEVDADTAFTWFKYNATSGLGYGAVFFEVWADTADLSGVHYAVGADRISPSVQFRGRTPFHSAADNLGSMVTDTLRSASGARLGVVDYLLETRGAQYLLQVHMRQPDSAAYNFRFMTTGSGRFDVWSAAQFGTSNMVLSPLPSPVQLPAIAQYVAPDNNKHMVDSWACSDHVITVANYYNEVNYMSYTGSIATVAGVEGDISANSSKGPTRDLRQKPDIAATGDITLTAAPLNVLANFIAAEPFKVAPGGMHIRNGGTSMASPVVTGAVALYLQKCPNATHQEVMQAILSTARGDAFTGAVPNYHWGHGKLDAFAALNTSNLAPVELTEPDPVCAGTAVEVEAPTGFASYLWSDGGSGNPLTYIGEGPLSVIATNTSGCRIASDTIVLSVWPLPATPTVLQSGGSLTSSVADNYQWYFDGQPIEGATGQSHEVGSTGNYFVVISDANGCISASEPMFILVTDIRSTATGSFAIWPSPAKDRLFVSVPGNGSVQIAVTIMDVHGKVMRTERSAGASTFAIPLEGLAAGSYTVNVRQGQEHWTERFVKMP